MQQETCRTNMVCSNTPDGEVERVMWMMMIEHASQYVTSRNNGCVF
jgi:hypothetical protein